MYVVIVTIHVIACLLLIGVVLLQQGRGADMGAVFGGGSSQTVFGASGAGNFLTRLTTGLAVTFMITSLTLTAMSGRRMSATVFDDAPPIEAPAPAGGAPAGAPEAAVPAAPEAAAPAAPEAAAPAPQPQAAAPEAAAPAEAPAQN